MFYLKDSFIVSSFLFLFIHSMTLQQGLVAVTTGVRGENPKKSKMTVALDPRHLES